MREAIKGMLLWICAAVMPVVLSACATALPMTSPARALYAAHSTYNNVLARFVSYAESSAANRTVVLEGKGINDKVRPAFRYSEAYIACTETGTVSTDLVVTAANLRCGDFKFDTSTLRENSKTLDSASSRLTGLIKGMFR